MTAHILEITSNTEYTKLKCHACNKTLQVGLLDTGDENFNSVTVTTYCRNCKRALAVVIFAVAKDK